MPEAFPEVAAVLERALAQYRKRKGQASLQKMAVSTAREGGPPNFSAAALSTWINGQRAPGDSHRKALAELFFDNAVERDEFIAELERAATVVRGDPLEAIMEGTRTLKVSQLAYPPFSGSIRRQSDNLLSDIFHRFCLSSSLELPDPVIMDLGDAGTIRSTKDDDDADLRIGLLCTAGRVRRYRFFETPIQVPLNALALSKDHDAAKQLLDTGAAPGAHRPQVLVWKGEMGHQYAQSFLENANVQCFDYHGGENDQPILSALRATHVPEPSFRMILADEVSCLRLWKRLHDDGTDASCVMSLAGASGSWLPRFHLSFAVARKRAEFFDYFAEAFPIFLRSDFLAIARRYKNLWDQLRAMAEPLVRHEAAESWANEILGLGAAASAPESPWSPTLRAVQELLRR